jgi:hypothetical protein
MRLGGVPRGEAEDEQVMLADSRVLFQHGRVLDPAQTAPFWALHRGPPSGTTTSAVCSMAATPPAMPRSWRTVG